ncbi:MULTISPECIES: M23 family metallopeptidase [unclassified Sphingomonas]|uniref:M23 family metallopeptidase n=1 Tax=unclassified Sphingomonas TaxID=196159 RepID=UPI0021516BF7|nr:MULTISPECIES: M23 family metallopeptidase [unclassified Sphingomonas]MCR5870676.1 M23 family metallopeptidase [Sphingomonas sp. J344]UUY00988.1 M23 family metallopeptidase [Sphingomonas sp. J315]
MADLAKTRTPTEARRRGTSNRDYTLPSRRDTDAPRLEINAPIVRPSGPAESAEILARTLGLATDVAAAIGENAMEKTAAKRAGMGTLDGARGAPDEALFAKSNAYREAFQLEGAKRGAFQLDLDVTKLIEDRLADEDDPATLDDIQGIIDNAFGSFATDDEGKPRDFGNPKASLAVAQQLNATRTRLMGAAYEAIRERTNSEAVGRVAFNVLQELEQGPIAAIPGAPPTLANLTPKAAAVSPVKAPTGRLPVQGRLTSGFGSRRAPTAGASTNHNGIDIAAPIGASVEAPASGKVIRVGKDKNSGNFVVIEHPGGVQTSYSHLSSVGVKKGDTVEAGSSFAKVGKTGTATGPNLHYVVRVDGKAVDPESFRFPETATEATADPNLQPAQANAEVAAAPAPLDFEAAMARVPDTVPRGVAKKALLSAFLSGAEEKKRPEWLDALGRSTRKDGSPSFSPEEIATIRGERDRIKENMRVEARRIRTERYEANEEILMSEMAQGRTPSIATIREWETRDDISGRFASALVDSIESDARQEARMATAEAREAERSADADLDFEAGAEADMRRTGVLRGATHEDDVRRFERGELGSGRRAVARFKMLRAAARQGEQARLSDPEVAKHAEYIDHYYKPPTLKGTSVQRALQGAGPDPVDPRPAMLAEYKKLIKSGEDPQSAYIAAIAKHGPNDERRKKAQQRRLQELRARQGGR